MVAAMPTVAAAPSNVPPTSIFAAPAPLIAAPAPALTAPEPEIAPQILVRAPALGPSAFAASSHALIPVPELKLLIALLLGAGALARALLLQRAALNTRC